MKKKMENKKYQKINFTDIKSNYCSNPELSNLFINDFLRVSGFEIDDEGYIIDTEDDPLDPEYIIIKGKFLRHTIHGIVHDTDLIFDPYNNCSILEELFKRYAIECHPRISSFQIFNAKKDITSSINCYGYLVALYDDGSQVITDNHWKDSTKFLDLWYRLESHDPEIIRDILRPYDEYENEFFDKEINNKDKLK